MKIEKITLCNLTSIEGEQTIDFTEEPLRSAGLFAITGDMGSGKSTILDAICLALYNKAPRFENIETIKSEELKLVEDKAQQVQPKTQQAFCDADKNKDMPVSRLAQTMANAMRLHGLRASQKLETIKRPNAHCNNLRHTKKLWIKAICNNASNKPLA